MISETMKGWALKYATMGLSVFPCHTTRHGVCSCGDTKCGSHGKHPMTQGGFKDATTDAATIRYWWDTWPDANIGYALQPDMAVVDVDIKHSEGKHGDKTLKGLEALHGPLPDTMRSLTGGGGVHHFFTTDTAVACKNSLFDSIDIKTHGGYVILPPSMHASGRRYEWEVGHGPGEIDVPMLPQWIIDARLAPAGTTLHTVAAKEPGKVCEGQRNDMLFKLASSLRARGLSEAAMLAALLEENKARCEPPLDDAEVGKLVHSAGKYEQGQVAMEWEQPIPFATTNTPDFPTDALPASIADFVDALAVSTQTPPKWALCCPWVY